jgi:hypothetical protein
MRTALSNRASRLLAVLAALLVRASCSLQRCPQCGRNPYTAPPCMTGKRTPVRFHRDA